MIGEIIALALVAVGLILVVIALSAVMLSSKISAEERREAFKKSLGGDRWD